MEYFNASSQRDLNLKSTALNLASYALPPRTCVAGSVFLCEVLAFVSNRGLCFDSVSPMRRRYRTFMSRRGFGLMALTPSPTLNTAWLTKTSAAEGLMEQVTAFDWPTSTTPSDGDSTKGGGISHKNGAGTCHFVLRGCMRGVVQGFAVLCHGYVWTIVYQRR